MQEHEIKELIKLVGEMGIVELRVERGDARIYIRREPTAEVSATGDGHPVPEQQTERQVILSPAVGRFCRSLRQGEPPAAEAGQSVTAGQIIGFVDTIGILGEVVSPVDGDDLEFLVEDGQGIEFGQPLARVRVAVADQPT